MHVVDLYHRAACGVWNLPSFRRPLRVPDKKTKVNTYLPSDVCMTPTTQLLGSHDLSYASNSNDSQIHTRTHVIDMMLIFSTYRPG